MASWEYKIAYLDPTGGHHVAMRDKLRAVVGDGPEKVEERIEKPLNQLGRDGWELVAIMPGEEGYVGILKRPAAR